MKRSLEIETYEQLFGFSLELNEKLLIMPDFFHEINGLIAKYFNYKNSLIIFSEDKFINIYDNVNLKKIYSQEYIDKDIKNDYILHNKNLFHTTVSESDDPKTLYLEDIISFIDYEQTDFYNNCFRERDIFYEAIIFLDEATSSLSLYKAKKDGNFTEKERLLISYIAKIVHQSYRLYQKINKMNADLKLLKQSRDISSLGNIIVSKDKDIIDYNTASVEFCMAMTEEINPDRALSSFITGLEESTSFTSNAEQNINYYTSEFKIEINTFINKTAYEIFEKNYLVTIAKTHTKKGSAAFMEAYNITTREQEIINCIARGLKNQETADELHISIHTVKAHIKNIFSKLQVNSQTAIIAKFNEYM